MKLGREAVELALNQGSCCSHQHQLWETFFNAKTASYALVLLRYRLSCVRARSQGLHADQRCWKNSAQTSKRFWMLRKRESSRIREVFSVTLSLPVARRGPEF